MSASFAEIHNRLRAADRALARVQGGSSELAHVREATGSLLVALHELVRFCERRQLAIGGLDVKGPFEAQPPATPAARPRKVRRQ